MIQKHPVNTTSLFQEGRHDPETLSQYYLSFSGRETQSSNTQLGTLSTKELQKQSRDNLTKEQEEDIFK
jgi:hypothetical protein